MIKCVLVAVDDSPGGLAALRFGVQLAGELRATLRAVMVVSDGQVRDALGHGETHGDTQLDARREAAADAVLRHAVELARAYEVPAEVFKTQGTVADSVPRRPVPGVPIW